MAGEATLAKLERLLEEERAALRAGRILELPRISEALSAMLPSLSREAETSPDRLRRLADRARRNTDLARAAGQGIRDATRRLAEVRGATGPIGSYGADGTRAEIGTARPAVERKA